MCKKKISKHQGKRTCIYDDNPDRRVRCPNWKFTEDFIKNLEKGAEENKISKSQYFEKVVENFFILEEPTSFIVASKRDYNNTNPKVKAPRMTLHPQIIEDIKIYASKISPSQAKYIELLFSKYHFKYGHEIKLKNLIHTMKD